MVFNYLICKYVKWKAKMKTSKKTKNSIAAGLLAAIMVSAPVITASAAQKGDVNGDGSVSVKDITVLRSFLEAETSDINPSADVNDDGSINILDLILLKKMLLNSMGGGPAQTDEQSQCDISDAEQEVMDSINKIRSDCGLSRLNPDSILCSCADIRAAELKECFNINRPDGSSYINLLIDKQAPGCFSAYEYIDQKVTSADTFIKRLENVIQSNPGEGVLDGTYNNIGAAYTDGYWTIFLTQ